MKEESTHQESRRERAARWISLAAGGPFTLIRGLSAIVAMLRAA